MRGTADLDRDFDQVRSLCVSWRHNKSQQRACIDSRMLSTTAASPCQTLCELLARETHTDSLAHQLAVWRMRSSPRVCTLVLFITLCNWYSLIKFCLQTQAYRKPEEAEGLFPGTKNKPSPGNKDKSSSAQTESASAIKKERIESPKYDYKKHPQ